METMLNDLEIPQELYDSKINFTISWLWNNGFEASIGIAPNFNGEATVRTYAEACQWLKGAAIMHYPESVFAKKYGGPPKVVTMPCRRDTDTE